MVERYARIRPLVLILDDAHWADEVSALALRILVPAFASSPVLWLLARRQMPRPSPAQDAIDWLIGMNFAVTKKYRDVARTGLAAIVIDDVRPPWRPRGIEIRGRAEALDDGTPRILIHPQRIIAWGLDDA